MDGSGRVKTPGGIKKKPTQTSYLYPEALEVGSGRETEGNMVDRWRITSADLFRKWQRKTGRQELGRQGSCHSACRPDCSETRGRTHSSSPRCSLRTRSGDVLPQHLGAKMSYVNGNILPKICCFRHFESPTGGLEKSRVDELATRLNRQRLI